VRGDVFVPVVCVGLEGGPHAHWVRF
jgi:hypothetical protein